ncbi:uncharacterized protein MELLADRAFT_113958 [Melampsora larici-populina 98AG31]|uniref:Uncharacterized protein n=1 Tax=Melampsora larici-populina (strain 98AG31 / pathotype 3-4-7) TaxID=747676 RepID=F4SBN5_MELLP|nr:uncharacterized protein MELLADRAFT_113958 [Melampsora larici-populina 98AG31]EGF97944.1 hypothetical protein MELLADRAFT_113958 [Melampsora larici-populina 98AG31]
MELLKTFSRFGNSREVFLSMTGTISTICRQDTFSEEDDDSIQRFSQPLIGSGFILVMVEILSIVICDKKIISSGRICFMKKYSRWNSSLERIINLDNEKMQKIEIIDEQESKMICNLLGEFVLNFGFDQGFESGELKKEIEATKELLIDCFGDEEELKKILRSSRFLTYAMNQLNQWEETGSIDSSIHIDEEVLIEALEDSDTNMIQAGIFIILSSSVPLDSQNFKLIDCLATCSVTIFSAELRFLCFRTLVHLIDSLEFKTKFDSLLHLFNTSSKYIKLEKALVNLVKEKMARSLGKAEEDQNMPTKTMPFGGDLPRDTHDANAIEDVVGEDVSIKSGSEGKVDVAQVSNNVSTGGIKIKIKVPQAKPTTVKTETSPPVPVAAGKRKSAAKPAAAKRIAKKPKTKV